MVRDLEQLQGIWSVTALTMDGRKMPAPMHENARIVIQGNRFTSTGMGAVYEGTVEIDETVKPRALTMRFDAGPEKGNTNLCIYKLKGDDWKLCIATRGEVRPTRFVSDPGSGIAVEMLTRGKAGVPVTTPPENRAEGIGTPATELEGTWQMISGIFDGEPMNNSDTQWVKRRTEGNRTTVTAGNQVMMQFEFTIDLSPSPRHLDYRNTAGTSKGKTQSGIYTLAGDLLTVCVSAPGRPRPTQFEPGRGCTITSWKRL